MAAQTFMKQIFMKLLQSKLGSDREIERHQMI